MWTLEPDYIFLTCNLLNRVKSRPPGLAISPLVFLGILYEQTHQLPPYRTDTYTNTQIRLLHSSTSTIETDSYLRGWKPTECPEWTTADDQKPIASRTSSQRSAWSKVSKLGFFLAYIFRSQYLDYGRCGLLLVCCDSTELNKATEVGQPAQHFWYCHSENSTISSDSKLRLSVNKCMQVLHPESFLEITCLDHDLLRTGSCTQRASGKSKIQMLKANRDIF